MTASLVPGVPVEPREMGVARPAEQPLRPAGRQTGAVTVEVRDTKQRLRTEVLAARQRLSATELAAAGASIATYGRQQWSGVATVAGYLALGTEPPTFPLLDALRAGGARILLPVITDTALDWAPYDGAAALAPGPLGIAEPTGARLGTDALTDAQVVLVPALAVDRDGNRLGRGRGYYDRALAPVTAPVVAVVFDAELLAAVPVEPHDRRVDAVLRPAGLTTLPT
jgi:5-formyltetrahydrofolate cyclo-ligase